MWKKNVIEVRRNQSKCDVGLVFRILFLSLSVTFSILSLTLALLIVFLALVLVCVVSFNANTYRDGGPRMSFYEIFHEIS